MKKQSLPYEESTLLMLISEGDQIAFRQIMHHYTSQLSGYIFRLVQSKETTKDILQEVFVKVWLNRKILSEIKNFRIFIFLIAHNLTLDNIKSTLRQQKRNKRFANEQTQSQPFDPFENYNRYNNLLDKAISQLPEQQRIAYILARIEGKKYHEVAQIMNISPETVKKYLQHANQNVNQFLSKSISAIIIVSVIEPSLYFF